MHVLRLHAAHMRATLRQRCMLGMRQDVVLTNTAVWLSSISLSTFTHFGVGSFWL